MNNNDERDYAEERANAKLLADPDPVTTNHCGTCGSPTREDATMCPDHAGGLGDVWGDLERRSAAELEAFVAGRKSGLDVTTREAKP